MSAPDGNADRVHTARVEAAVRRARRVESHSLAQDKTKLRAWSEQETQLRFVDGVPVEMSRQMPPVEALESLAGRCRPFLLSQDAIHYPLVFKSLGYFMHGDPQVTETLRSLRRSWAVVDRGNDNPMGGWVKQQTDSGGFDEGLSFKQLGYAWLYADLAHAHEDERRGVEGHDLDSRYRAGAALIAATAFNVIALLNVARDGRDQGLLPIDDDVFSEPTEPATSWRTRVIDASGPFGTA